MPRTQSSVVSALYLLLLLLLAAPVLAQDAPAATAGGDNPLAALKDELSRTLADASIPFTPDQERAITLMMEDRRRASESLFGDLLNFSAGPTSGQDADRLKSAIEWMRGEFATRIRGYLTPEQLTVWEAFEAKAGLGAQGDAAGGERQSSQTQFVRINNNAFTSEDFFFGGDGFSGTPDVIERGGAGAWHGNLQYLMKDEALNARNPFAANKPPYQEREFAFDIGGPAIPGRLTTNIAVEYTRAENVGTVRATLPSNEIFALGITRPSVERAVEVESTFQIADAHSVRGSVRFEREISENENIGGFTLPERASTSRDRDFELDLNQFSALSSTRLFESRIAVESSTFENIPLSDAVRINVPDAFQSGGAQNASHNVERAIEFGTLYTQFGENLTIKAGTGGTYRRNTSESTNNFGGTFNFSSLDAFVAGTPLNYRVTRGSPLLETDQFELGAFIQNDLQLTQQFTLMFGVRYDGQTNLSDYDNVAPRASFAWGIGSSTVIRGGAGRYYQRLDIDDWEDQLRFDGTRQFEIVIDNPSYPDPFLAGSVRQSFPSVRVTDPALQAPNSFVGTISVERTFWRTFLVTTTYEYQREHNRFRLRNLNAPMDITSAVPRACQPGQGTDTCVRPNLTRGNINSYESTGRETSQALRVSMRHRFSIFSVTANYELERTLADLGGQLPTDNFDLRADYARTNDPLHVMDATVNARLPFDLFLSGSIAANSGNFYTVTTGRDDNRDTNTNDRPAGIERNSERGPRYLNFDFNLSKAIFIGGTGGESMMNVNVFANLTNAFNRVHYGTPSGVVTSPNFGRSTSAFSPREIEVGFRFQF